MITGSNGASTANSGIRIAATASDAGRVFNVMFGGTSRASVLQPPELFPLGLDRSGKLFLRARPGSRPVSDRAAERRGNEEALDHTANDKALIHRPSSAPQ
jgi:hypothetical protein